MRTASKIFAMLALTLLLAAPPTGATNGDNLIAVGPIARAMGGVGVAAPQDAISAVFANPAAMCFGPYCPSSEINFAGTAFMPKVSTKIQSPIFGTVQADSDEKTYAIPAFGLSLPIGKDASNWRFGLSACYRTRRRLPGHAGGQQHLFSGTSPHSGLPCLGRDVHPASDHEVRAGHRMAALGELVGGAGHARRLRFAGPSKRHLAGICARIPAGCDSFRK